MTNVTKPKDKVSNTSLNRKFIKDYRLPIAVAESPYFEYYLELYDSLLDTKEKYSTFLEDLKKTNDKNYNELFRDFVANVIEHVQSKESYKEFIGTDFTKYSERYRPKNTVRKLLTPNNSGKKFISIDMEKANFHAFKTFNIDLVDGNDSYEEWIENFENGELFSKVKSIRQLIFGNLNPKRQQGIEGFYMSELIKDLDSVGLFDKHPLIILGSDEVVIEFSEENYAKILNVLVRFHNRKDSKFKFRLDVFTLEKLTEYEEFGYVKTAEDGSLEFKNTSKLFYAQMVKHYLGLPLHEYDLLYVNDVGYLSKMLWTVQEKYERKTL